MAAAEADGDRIIEIVSAGAIYRAGEWERKYWSCSRGKDRYPYPVGYHAVRRFAGISYSMEIHQGPRGPVFQVTSTQGDSSTGQTPDIAWKNLHKKTAAKVRNWQRKRSFPQKIDGVELFGFKNASVQRLLRELLIHSAGAVELNSPHPVNSDVDSPLAHKVEADSSDDHEDLPVCLDKTGGTAKRGMRPSQEEGIAKRVHYQDISTSVENCNNELDKSADQVSNEGGSASREQLQDVSGSRCMAPLLEEIPCNSKYSLVHDNVGKPVPDSSQQVGLSSSSYLSSERSDLELADQELAKSMMSILLPQAIPLLKKSRRKKKVKRKKELTVSTQNPSADDCQGAAMHTSTCEGMDIKSSQTYVHVKPLCEMVKDKCTNDDGMFDEPVVKLDDMAYFVADSFEDDEQICGDNTSKPMGFHHHESDDACSREPYENSKLPYGKTEDHNDGMVDEPVIKLDDMTYFVADSFEDDEQICGNNTSKPMGSHHHESDDACSREPYENSKLPCGKLEDHDDGMVNEPVIKLDDMTYFVADSFEDDEQICGDNTSKPTGSHHHESDDACSREPHENSKLSGGKTEDHDGRPDCQKGDHDGTETPDIIYDHEKGQYVLSDAFIACLEEEFGENDCSYLANYSHHDDEQPHIEPKFDDPTNGINNGSSQKNSSNGLIDVCAQASAKNGPGILSNEESLSNILQDPCLSNAHNNTVGCGSKVSEHVPPKDENNVGYCHHDHAFPGINGVNGHLPKYKETSMRASDLHLDLIGCYLHPMPVLSIMLNTKNNSSLQICILCGSLESCQRFLYVYNINPKYQQETAPYFVGYTPLLLPSLEYSLTGNLPFERSGLQFTPDGQFLVLLSSIRIPSCRRQSIDCSCSLCKFDHFENNYLKIVSVNLGYVSLLTKLMPYGTLSCMLICEPNYIVTVEDGRKLHIWMMAAGWSSVSEEYVIPSLGNVGPSILELRRMPKGSSLIIGHDGAGTFCLWDVSKRTLLATFAAPGNIVFQILPLGSCSLQDDIMCTSVDEIETRLREITVSGMSRKTVKESILMPPGDDTAIWILISSASVAEYQHDFRAKEHNARWRLALLTKKAVYMGNILDPRATAVDASGNYGLAGTYGGLLYTWELSSGRKLASTQCFNCGRVSCIAVDAKSGVVAVADDACQLLVYSQNRVLSSAREGGNMFMTR